MAFLRRIWNKWQNLLHDEKLKHKIYVIIFESDTPMGKLFDVALIGFIVLSILVVIAESIKSWDTVIGPYLRVSEYVFTFFFTLEYVLRLYCSPQPRKYALSFFGIVDLLATLPLYIGWLFGTARYLLVHHNRVYSQNRQTSGAQKDGQTRYAPGFHLWLPHYREY